MQVQTNDIEGNGCVGSPQTTDWVRIRAEYEAGGTSIRAIGKANGVSHTAIRKKAAADGWVSTPTSFHSHKTEVSTLETKVSTPGNQNIDAGNQGGVETRTKHQLKKAAKKAKEDAEWREWFAEDCRVRNLAAEKEELEWERDNPLEDYSHSNRDAIPHDTIPLSVFLNAEGHVSIMQPKADGEDDAAVGRDMWRRRSKDYGIGGKRTNGRNEDKVVQIDLRCIPALIARLQQLARE